MQATTLVLLLMLGPCAADPCEGKAPGHVLDSRFQTIGHGFRLVDRQVCNGPEHWEGIGHFRFLYFEDRELGQISFWSISPSGRYALFENIGKLLLFDKEDASLRDVTDAPFAIPRRVTWREETHTVAVEYYDTKAPSAITLSD